MVKAREDMTGWIMSEHGVADSRLTVLGQVEDKIHPNGSRKSMWLCQCSCGSEPFAAVGSRIRNGRTKSCGCLRVELCKENKVDLSGEYGILWTTNTDEEVYFDLQNAELILQHTWFSDGQGYPTTKIKGKKIRMHAFLGYKGHDHKDRNQRNNKVNNLRPCTQQENMRNRSQKTGCKNKYIGVTMISSGKWRATITIDGKQKHLGLYLTEEEALVVRLRAEHEYYRDFAPQRHLFEQFGIC